VSWRSTSQSCVTLSSIKVEYMITMETTKEAIWLQKMVMSDLSLAYDPYLVRSIASENVM
jgi:hypothetical protein